MDIALEKIAQAFSSLENYLVKTASREAIADELLAKADSVSAIGLVMALRSKYGIEFLYWEPETTWVTLDKDGFDLSELSRDKVQAGLTAIHNPAFFWDNLAFQRTVQAFNSVPYDPETLQECHPAHMAWAVYEATLFRGIDPDDSAIPELDEDVQQYVAVCLKRAGMVCPPSILSPVADNLMEMLPESSRDFAQKVKKSWQHLDKEALQERKFSEDPLGVQLAQLAACHLYEREQAENMARDVLRLEEGISP